MRGVNKNKLETNVVCFLLSRSIILEIDKNNNIGVYFNCFKNSYQPFSLRTSY